ncbi:MAG: hypothetical protein ACRC2T_17845 [Thermoguttaceae bacterium]
MSEPTLKKIAEVVNRNADILDRHLKDGVFVHKQTEPATVWPIMHKLGSLRPLIETYDDFGNRIGHAVNRQTQTFDYAEIVFAIPMSGVALIRF